MNRDLHQSKNPQLRIEDALSQGTLVIDVRAPKEFAQGHVPGAVNLPLLEDDERHLIGLIYKQQGPQAAIAQGYEVFEPKRLALLERLQALPQNQPWAVYCARGGMRSQVMTGFLNHSGFAAQQVQGGYKAYRRYCLDRFEEVDLSNLVVLHGQTGVGKTRVIVRLENALDLEGYAQHRGSMFGGIGLEPNSQKQFEALLVQGLNGAEPSRPLFVEGESRKIGPVDLPQRLYQTMMKSRCLLLTAPLELRAQRITEEYVTDQPEQRPRIREVITRLYPSLGHHRVAELLALFDQGDYEACFAAILSEYYDPKYNHSLQHFSCEEQVEVLDTAQAAAWLNRWG